MSNCTLNQHVIGFKFQSQSVHQALGPKRKFPAIAIFMAILVGVTALLPVSSYGDTFTLDFGNHYNSDGVLLADLETSNPDFIDLGGYPDFNNDGTYTMYFQDVFTGADATLVADGPWGAFKSDSSGTPTSDNKKLQWPHGSIVGDIRVFADYDQVVPLTLNLWEADTDYLTPYDPGVPYDWSLVFYDIDSNPSGYSWDEVTLLGTGTYTVTTTNDLTITPVSGGVNFSGLTTFGDVDTQEGATTLTAAQSNAAVMWTLYNQNSVDFLYTVGKGDFDTLIGRNLLIDGGLLTLLGDTETYPVPVPSAVILGMLGLSVAGVKLRKRE